MRTEAAEIFREFVTQLTTLTGVKLQKIEAALDVHDGLSGILREGYFILGYQQLGWLLARELTIKEIEDFGANNTSFLTQDEGDMYFFTQALMEKSDISSDARLGLILSMPEQYQQYLLMRFGFCPIS
ncbi:hypothetical protein [Tateyamaria sp.]|uniref:hypothetical protein n=1 Tax=Tateyamaria sp. TaxID=1929288 RepID=UPI00329D5F13